MKTILELCRALPASEPELRERAREFGALLAENCLGWQWWKSTITGKRCLYAPDRNSSHTGELADGNEPLVTDWNTMSLPDPFAITGARAATDAMVARECYFEMSYDEDWIVQLAGEINEGCFDINVRASTEELARSAAALLAAEAIKEKT